MAISADQINQIPEPYKTFLQALWPVVISDDDGSLIRVTGIPLWMISRAVGERHGYTEQQVRELSRILQDRGWIERDDLGFYIPKGQGVAVLRRLNQVEAAAEVPGLPVF
jgi:hypothetical protein